MGVLVAESVCEDRFYGRPSRYERHLLSCHQCLEKESRQPLYGVGVERKSGTRPREVNGGWSGRLEFSEDASGVGDLSGSAAGSDSISRFVDGVGNIYRSKQVEVRLKARE